MTDHSRVGGVLSIISGAFGIIGSFCAFMWAIFFPVMMDYAQNRPDYSGRYMPHSVTGLIGGFIAVWGFFVLAFAIMAIIGGVFSLRREKFGVALAGAICAALAFFWTGIPAIIFIAMGNHEFAGPENATPPTISASPTGPATST